MIMILVMSIVLVTQPEAEPIGPEEPKSTTNSNIYEHYNPGGIIVLAEEVLDAARVVGEAIQRKTQSDTPPELVSSCVTDGAILPSYQLIFRQWKSPVCVYRPWRLISWEFDLDNPSLYPTCDCEKSPHVFGS